MELKKARKICAILCGKEKSLKWYSFEEMKMAIETVLKELKRLQEDNYKLDRENQLLFEHSLEANTMLKNKIEDKIEELREENEVITQEEYYARSYIRKFLKDLLEEN